MNALSFLLFGSPDRIRYSVISFWIVAAILAMLALRVKPYRRTIMTLGVVLAVFYAPAFFGAFSPRFLPAATPPDGNVFDRTTDKMAQMRETMTWMGLFVGSLAVIAVFLSDRAANRLRKIVAAKRDGPWTR